MNRHIVDSSWGFGLVFLLLRVPSLLVVLGWWCPSEALQYLQSPLRHSIFSDAWSVLPTLHQATAIRRLVRPHQWVNVYQGGDIGVPRPLFLVAVESTSALQLWWWCFRALVDLLLVRLLKTLAERSEERQDVREDILLTNMKKKILPRMAERPHIDSALMAAAYAFSPIVAFDASCQNLSLLCLLWAFDAASPIWTGVALAVSTYLETPTVVFLIPSVLWRRDARLLIPFAMTILFLYTLSYALTGDSVFWELWNKPPTIHEPSLSVQWYLQMELFDRFRLYFGWLIPGLPYLLVAPLSIRLWRYPMALVRFVVTHSCEPAPHCSHRPQYSGHYGRYSAQPTICGTGM